MNKSALWVKLKSFFIESRRVIKITRKPTSEEFKTIVKVTGLGTIAIGLIGYIISVAGNLLGV